MNIEYRTRNDELRSGLKRRLDPCLLHAGTGGEKGKENEKKRDGWMRRWVNPCHINDE